MIAHVDADSFFASVLVRKDPRLRGKPLLALGMGGGCVIAASYEAKAKGVRTGMRLVDAIKLCPEALKVHSDFRETGVASNQLETILEEHCPFFEQFSIDEWFLDLPSIMGGVPPNLSTWGTNVRQEVLLRTGLSVSVGIGSSKLLAKMASEYRKPGGVTVVLNSPLPEGIGVEGEGLGVRAFLEDRPAAAIPGIGPRRQVHTQRLGWHTAWDIATANPGLLKQQFGKSGIEMQRELQGELLSPVARTHAPPKSVSRARSFAPLKDKMLLWAHTLRHLEYTVLKMRRHDLACRGITVWLRDNKYLYESAHASLPQLFNTEDHVRPYVERCFRRLYEQNYAYTQVGLALWNLRVCGGQQFSLFEDPQKAIEREALQKSLDELHERYGRQAITRGSALQISSGTKPALNWSVYE